MQWKRQRYGLPSTFISYFALAGLEKDEDVKSSMLHALNLCVKDKRHQVWSLINVTRGSILITLKMAYLRVISQQIGFIPKNYTLFSVSRPVFRYFMPLGPRIFCAPPPFVRIQLCSVKFPSTVNQFNNTCNSTRKMIFLLWY